jgi:hypothetical protein
MPGTARIAAVNVTRASAAFSLDVLSDGLIEGEVRRLSMTRLGINAARCEALFSSGLQEPT